MKNVVSSDENIARIIRNEWISDGELLITAFALAPKETYLSVNRPSVESYQNDVREFISKHPDYQSNNNTTYNRALMNVGDVRNIDIQFNGKKLNVDVEVEPRDSHTKSHAGIFVRTEKQNVIHGRELFGESVPAGISADDILHEVRWALYDIAELQKCKL
ncbi:MAG: hypothetical protein II852_03535 [Bacteroidales bacterium]|nr:hypothetical protein [Bacteroidales bacterium]